jgi:flagellar protein FlaF
MHSAAKAYGAVSQAGLPPRELEAHVLLKAATRIQQVLDDWDVRKAEFEPVLLNNRKLWTVLVSSVTDESNPLPRAIKQNVANLAIFIFKRTLELTQEPDPRRADVLVQINRNIAEGLRARAEAA